MATPQPILAERVSTKPRAASVPVVPLAAIALLIIVTNLVFIAARLLIRYPISPWEAGIVNDAWRMMTGAAVYAKGTDHATHMYGPLITVILSQVFRITGPVLQAGRIFSALCGVGLVFLLGRIFAGRNWVVFAITSALVLAGNGRTGVYFTETRPDVASLLFATLAVVVLYRGLELNRQPQLSTVLAGSALLVIAVLFKQTAVPVMLIPAIAVAGPSLSTSRKQVLAAGIPLAVVGVTLFAIWAFLPGVWHFFAEVPAQYRVPVARCGRRAWEFVETVPLLFIALFHWLATDAPRTWDTPRARWLVSSLLITIPTSIVASAKDGGGLNSLMPALVAAGAFCAWRIPAALSSLRDETRPMWGRVVMAGLFAMLLFVQVYPTPETLAPSLFYSGHGVTDRALVIAETRLLPGKVVCPDDPTIPLIAKGYAGRSAAFESDAVYWRPDRADAMIKEFSTADYAIVMRNGAPGGPVLVPSGMGFGTGEDLLRANGFTKSAFRTTSTPAYELWVRSSPAVQTARER